MVNIWDFVNAKKIEVIDVDGNKTIGSVVCVMDSEENGEGEDDLSIQVDNDTIIGFLQSEIKSIEKIE